ncbi:Retrovirus-related Pol polyprotein from type-1 retrotransposable element R1 [Araneus ventricosus]|uniref:Retrovirus-related Pol polyprotein from type-1 retrotransposable element R1 n=1 Tax=Araneus ventricosus TaxID=182803 RepID=A0A4Y2HVN2_ARAVE|nr:Retrovirus-related Pol polyprotein from type-1 retrotransposable element R1 [Araneus ventricosus]
MTQRLTYHLESTKRLNDRQHDFKEGKSVDIAINELLRKIKTARRDDKHILVLSIDIKGAFDNLQHRAILKSLDASACPRNINRLFHSLLQNRKVTLLTPQSRATKDQKQGCPQGSCSGPALWNLVANEILYQVWPDNVNIQAFADDFVLVIKADANRSLLEDTQSAITQFSSWCSENELAISTEETNYILFSKMWSAKLKDNNTVFQAELTALHEAVIYASHLPNHNTSKIHVDNGASIMASSNSKSTNKTARKIFKILLSNPRIEVSWVKTHEGNIGNERADQLAKDATQHGQPYSHTKLPKPHIKSLLRKRMLEEWQTSWKNGDTGITPQHTPELGA